MEKSLDFENENFKQNYKQLIEELENIHGYKIDGTLGEGSFGIVLSATRLQDGK